MEDIIFRSAVQYIERNLKESLNLAIVADFAGYSTYHFSRLFQQRMQCSVGEYIRKRRLYKASEEIFAGKRIVDVAFEYGWQSHNSFTRAFKTEYGFPPSLLKALRFVLVDGGTEMKNYTYKKASEEMTKEELLHVLKETLIENSVAYDENKLMQMYALSCQAYEGLTRYSGNEYVTHPLHVAIVLADMEADVHSIYAGMFCDVLKKTKVKAALLKKDLPADVWKLVKKVNTCEYINGITDERVLLIKLAERLHNMRTVEFMNESKIREKVQETFEVFLPIARKLGNEKLAAELNDLTMKYI